MLNPIPLRLPLLNLMYGWLSDSGLTPFLVADASYKGVDIPAGIVAEGQVVLNLSLTATSQLAFAEEGISFLARFSGKAHSVWIPLKAVKALYARESGAGVYFTPEAVYIKSFEELAFLPQKENMLELQKPTTHKPPPTKPVLKRIK